MLLLLCFLKTHYSSFMTNPFRKELMERVFNNLEKNREPGQKIIVYYQVPHCREVLDSLTWLKIARVREGLVVYESTDGSK